MNKNISTEINSLNLIKYALYKDYYIPEELSYLNLTQERILITVKNSTNSTMVSIAREIGLEKGPFSQTIDKLEKIELIERIRSPEDKRNIKLKLTKKGDDISSKILFAMEDHFKSIVGNLSEKELNDLFKAFNIIKSIANKLLQK
nr:MarR family winged helix-turn-helix transcriptional regulator [uncultured Carboxylicivirga sp.]